MKTQLLQDIDESGARDAPRQGRAAGIAAAPAAAAPDAAAVAPGAPLPADGGALIERATRAPQAAAAPARARADDAPRPRVWRRPAPPTVTAT
ncbi:hypothetical protein [uncultured Massilia sp.]|uniref:hypothetical protein n=1 Tax=uncultured Massilia sp. TaxID=169973 RepID=UPI0025E54789|nr:hypothetical protein [uncultured Massilia sp.]